MKDGKALKLFHEGMAYADVKREYDTSVSAFRLGMPSPQPFDIVSAEGRYGITCEHIQGETLSKLITNHPEHINDYAALMANIFRKLHSTTVKEGDNIPNAHLQTQQAIMRIEPIIGSKATEALLNILRSIPQERQLLHCDLHPRNIMIDGNRHTIIDVGEVGYGNSLLDLANTHTLLASGLLDVERFLGFPAQYAKPLWNALLREYLDNPTDSIIKVKEKELESLGRIRCFTWITATESLPDEVTTRFRQLANNILND